MTKFWIRFIHIFVLFIPYVAFTNEPTPVDRFYIAEGLEATVWAQAPLFFNPTNMDTDVQGCIWVTEAVNYRSFRNEGEVNLWHKDGDRIMVLQDVDGDGRADSSHVFVQDKDLVAPMGLSVLDNRIIVTCSPNVIVYTDVDRDARFDPAVDEKEILLTGFGGFDHDHSLHTVKAGPDGDLYFTTGNTGPHIVTDRSGWTLRTGSSYRGGAPSNDSNVPGLVSDDGRVYVGGVAVRMSPDGTNMRVIGQNFRNPYELCLDSFGNVFQNDNDDTISCRTTWVMEYGSPVSPLRMENEPGVQDTGLAKPLPRLIGVRTILASFRPETFMDLDLLPVLSITKTERSVPNTKTCCFPARRAGTPFGSIIQSLKVQASNFVDQLYFPRPTPIYRLKLWKRRIHGSGSGLRMFW